MIFPGEIEKVQGASHGHNISPLTAANFVLSAGWGSTATVTNVFGFGGAWRITVTANGSGITSQPTITLMFEQNSWTFPPVCLSKVTGGTGSVTDLVDSPTINTWIITYDGLPVAGSTYTISGVALGT